MEGESWGICLQLWAYLKVPPDRRLLNAIATKRWLICTCCVLT